MNQSEESSEFPKYGVLFSVRNKAKKTNDLLNSISIKFGRSILWRQHFGAGGKDYSSNRILRNDADPIWFKLQGNKFANSLELSCKDIAVLLAVKQAFPEDFTSEVQIKAGLL
jgi:hypothetical protein